MNPSGTQEITGRLDRLTFLLGATAAVLSAVLIAQVGRLGSLSEARADVVSRVADYTIMTFNGGNDDVMMVLDGRGEQVFVYRVRNQNTVELLQRETLGAIFETGRRMGPGGRGN